MCINRRVTLVLLWVSVLSIFIPSLVSADTFVGSKTLTKSEVWGIGKSPYHVQGNLIIPSGVQLTVSVGTDLYLDSGSVTVLGSLLVQASVHVAQSFPAIQVKSGSIEIQTSTISDCHPFIEAYNKASVRIADSQISNCTGFGPIISAWNNSNITLDKVVFRNIHAPYAVEVFNTSTLVAEDSVFESAGTESAIAVHNNLSGLDIQDSEFKGNMKVGIEGFGNAILYIQGNTFTGFESAVQLFGGANSEIYSNSFSANSIGIEAYSSSSTVSQNIFEQNTEDAVLVSGGFFNAIQNWWGNSTGPHHVAVNTTGTGDPAEGDMSIAPWLIEKPNLRKCCSTVLFFPGFEGSRLYTKGYLFENQLWEPNRDADVQKLFMDTQGNSKKSGIYTRDAILRTNIGFGIFDTDIYAGLDTYLKDEVRKKIIAGYKILPYDWRFDSKTVVDKNNADWVREVIDQAKKSKTGKVILVGHSFGGLVAEQFMQRLAQSGKSNLVDSLVLIGAPEQGSFESALSVLHGDGQELGLGIVFSQAVARQFAKNLASVYELFPKEDMADSFTGGLGNFSNKPFVRIFSKQKNDSDLLKVHTGQSSTAGGAERIDIHTIADFEDFVFRKGKYLSRAVTDSVQNIRMPEVGNANLYRRVLVDNAQSAQNIFGPTDSVALGIPGKIFNIVGTGLPTISGLDYSEKCTVFGGTESFAVPVYVTIGTSTAEQNNPCFLDRQPLYSYSGDSVVPLGNTQKRIGTKVTINIEEYNRIHEGSVNHANFASSDPVLTLLNDILHGNSLQFSGASYIQTMNETLLSGSVFPPGGSSVDTGPNQVGSTEPKTYYKIRVDSPTSIQIEDQQGKKLQDKQIGTAYVSVNKIPNAVYTQIGDSRFVLVPTAPKSIVLQNSQKFGPATIRVDSVTADSSSGIFNTSISSPVYVFSGVPTAPTVKNEIVFNPNSQNSVPELHTDYESDGVIDEVTMPVVVAPVVASTSTPVPTIEELIEQKLNSESYTLDDIKIALARIKIEIRNSTAELKFKDRYINKIESIERRIASYPVQNSQAYSTKIRESLLSIIAEIQEHQNRFYKGGLKVADASFLYVKFYKIYRMFLFLIVD